MSYGSSTFGVAVPVVLASSSDRKPSSSSGLSSSSRAPSSAAASSSAVSLASELSSYSPSESDVTRKRRKVRDVESGPVCVWPSVGMGEGGLP